MAAPTYVLARCATCHQLFNVEKDSDAYARMPFVCDGDFAGLVQAAFDHRQGSNAAVSRIPEENAAVLPRGILGAPAQSQPTQTLQQAQAQIVPSYQQLLERVDPEEAARQAVAHAPDAPGTVAEVVEPEEPAEKKEAPHAGNLVVPSPNVSGGARDDKDADGPL